MNTEDAAKTVGVTFRQIDNWVKTGIIAPSGPPAVNYHNGAPARRWTKADLARLRAVAQIMAMGEGGERRAASGDTARLIMKHWRKGPGWLVISPATTKGVVVTAVESVPKAIRKVGGRALVVPLP